MKILSVRHIDGPNIYLYKPVLVARVDLESLTERESYDITGFSDKLLRMFPGLREHHCAKGEPGGFVERLYGGTYFGHIAEHLAIELASCCGLDVHYGKTQYAGSAGIYDIVMECESYDCQKFLLQSAMEIVQGLIAGEQPRVDDVIRQATAIHARTQLGPSTQAIGQAARRRNIPVRRVNDGSLVQLGYGRQRKLVEATITENTSAVSVDIACDKDLTKKVLEEAGLPVPSGEVAASVQETLKVFRDIGAPVVVKPYNGNQGRGVSLNLCNDAEVIEAYHIAAKFCPRVLVERYVKGRHIRALVVDGKFVAASERLPTRVVGDGVNTIADLVEAANANPLRGSGHEKPLTKIVVDPVVMNTLRRQNLSLRDIPDAGQVVTLRNNGNLSTGGEAVDVTDELHPTYKALAERTARVVGLDVSGIDMVIEEFDVPYQFHGCAVIEVNAAPGIRMHQHPSYGERRDAGEAIVNALYPHGNGRIPIVSITGTNGKTTTTRLIAHALSQFGKNVGMTTTGGVWIGGQQVVTGDTTGPSSARMVLSDPSVDVAVLETARGGIVRGGLAYDKANVAVITNVTLDHIGQDFVESVEDLLHIKSLVAECVWEDGTVVLNADDSNLVELGKRLKSKIAYFSTEEDNPVLTRHLACGGVGYYLSEGWLMEGRGHLHWQLVPLEEAPLTVQGTVKFQVENCLAAIAALRGVGCTRQQVAAALSSFLPNQHNPGRCMLYQMPGRSHVVLDYGHNPAGFEKIGSWLQAIPHRRLIGVVGVPGDRSDRLVRKGADCLAEIFDVLVVKEDADKRGRYVGEVAEMMANQIAQRHPEKRCAIILDEPEALQFAIAQSLPGDVVVMFYEKLKPAVAVVTDLGGVQTDTFTQPTLNSIAVR